MIQKRIEILKTDGNWSEIELFSGEGIKYNNVINKISNTTERSLSHSNTFKIPWTKKNIDTLGLNVYNTTLLANSLNEKYEAKYYVGEKLLQEGFVVINNMDNGVTSLNFIDKALSLTDKWGSTTYKDFLQDDDLLSNVDSDYVAAIDIMKTYDMDKTSVLPILQNISGEDFPIAYFPNTVNCIGEKFQVDGNGIRLEDRFNPYQSRPLFNVQAFLDMVTQAYGYTLIKNDSVDWDKVKVTAISSEKIAKGEIDEGSSTLSYPSVATSNSYWNEYRQLTDQYTSHTAFQFPSGVGITPSSISLFAPNGVATGINTPNYGWFNNRTIFVPNLSGGSVGLITFQADFYKPNTSNVPIGYIIFKDTTNSGGYVFQAVVVETNNSTTLKFDITINKSQFENPTVPNAGDLVGLYLTGISVTEDIEHMYNMVVTEEVLSGDVVTYDDFGQFEQDEPDLTHTAPLKTIKEIVNGVLQRFGALIEINAKEKTVEIFTYEAYGTKRTNGDVEDWSDYHLEYMPPNFNTNYGNKYAVKNNIGLSNPFIGNSVDWYLGNQNVNSKLKEFAKDYNSHFADITNLIQTNYTNTPYDEFSIEGASMLEFKENLGTLTQRRFDNSTQGNITGVPNLINVNYAQMPKGQEKWYNLIDESVRCRPTFLLPQVEIEFLDIKKPIYVNSLGGFYIIEEIEQYEDESTPVRVKLIKLPSSWE